MPLLSSFSQNKRKNTTIGLNPLLVRELMNKIIFPDHAKIFKGDKL